MSQPEIIIIGAGVSGLSCGVLLAEEAAIRGARVRILTKDPPSETTSTKAGAVWYPYRAGPLERVFGWSLRSLERFYELIGTEPVERTGVFEIVQNEYFDREPAGGFPWREAIPEYEGIATARRGIRCRGGVRRRWWGWRGGS